MSGIGKGGTVVLVLIGALALALTFNSAVSIWSIGENWRLSDRTDKQIERLEALHSRTALSE